jgi:hypothetical protein
VPNDHATKFEAFHNTPLPAIIGPVWYTTMSRAVGGWSCRRTGTQWPAGVAARVVEGRDVLRVGHHIGASGSNDCRTIVVLQRSRTR